MTRAAAIAVILTLVAAPSALATEKPMGPLATAPQRHPVSSCTDRLKEKFNIGPLNGLDVTHMDANGARPDGAMDKFEVVTTEKKSLLKKHFVGVCT
jgi:hypothetical protein